jgi:two-component system sensor histidine kinase/response regulator
MKPPETRVDILLVDDRPENLVSLEAALVPLGTTLVKARSGEDALKCLLKQDFAVILLDVMMPGMDGFETAELIRARSQSRHTPIIFMTAFNRGELEVSRGYKLGAVDFLFKPIEIDVLRSKVSVFVDLYRKTEEIRLHAELLRETERLAHERELVAARERWETDRLREEFEKERTFARQLAESYAKLQETEKSRDDLMHMIVHDLRTPLTSLLTGLHTMHHMGGLSETHEEILNMSVSGGETLLDLINDLLDISKMESGSMDLKQAALSPMDVAEQALKQVRSLAQERRLELCAGVGDDLPPVEMDGEKVCRALVNLLGNAIKFTPPGGVVTLSARCDDEKHELTFSVADTGEGIPSDKFDLIFEKFGQVEGRKTGKMMSTGLGLTFCKLVSEAHGGRIWVESELGKGSVFHFTLPLASSCSGEQNELNVLAQAA